VRQRRYCTARDSIVDGGLPRIPLLQLSSWVFVCVGTVGGPSWVVLVSAVCCIVILMLPLSTDHSAPVAAAAAGDGWSLYCSLHVSLHQKLIAAYILGTVRPADRPTDARSVCLSVCLSVCVLVCQSCQPDPDPCTERFQLLLSNDALPPVVDAVCWASQRAYGL